MENISKSINFRTDLADERRDIYAKANSLENEIQGIEVKKEEIDKNIKISTVKILNEIGEKALDKPKGTYITIDIKNIKIAGDDEKKKASEVVTNNLKPLIEKHIDKKEDILVVGLGNIYVTPDSLGPKVINEIDVTRHLIKYVPQYMDENSRPVSAIAPGVLGTTGIETMEILNGVINNIKPKLVIAIDCLASKSIERVSSSIQIADTGIVPGSGVGNTRKALNEENLGVKVIAVGVPTVVNLATITDECLDIFISKLQDEAKSNDILNTLKEQDNFQEIQDALIPSGYDMIVTPKEIDGLIENMKDIIARGINFAI